VIGRGRGRIAPVIPREHQHASVQTLDELRDPRVERLDAPRVSLRVVPVTVLAVEVHEIREDQRRTGASEVPKGDVDPVVVRARVLRLREPAAREDVPDLPDAEDRDPRLQASIQEGGTRWRQGEVPAIRGPDEAPGLARERPRDDAAHGVVAGQDLARSPAPVIEDLERDDVDVTRDLEDGVPARVDDRATGSEVLLTELRDDLGA